MSQAQTQAQAQADVIVFWVTAVGGLIALLLPRLG
jgi:hypothetical protein